MVWKAEAVGPESAKCRWDVVPYANGRGIDIGCGERKVFPSFLGVDNCVDAILRRREIKPDLVADAQRLELFTDQTFDCVFSAHVLDCIPDYRAALADWWRLVKVGGHLILYLPHADLHPRVGQPGSPAGRRHDFMPSDILAVMRELGGWDLLENDVRDQADECSFLLVFRRRSDQVCNEQLPAVPAKSIALVRLGAFGDALWLSSVLPHLKAADYHVTVYTQEAGELVLRHDPYVDRIIVMSDTMFSDVDRLLYWVHEQGKYDRFINLVGSVESRLLPQPRDFEFWWADEVRRRVMNANYLQTVHDWCGVEAAPRVRFYPNAAEIEEARARRASMAGPVVVLNPAGSGQFKWFPHVQRFMDRLAERQVHCVVLGDSAGPAPAAHPVYGHLVGRTWGMRGALAFAQLADVVVGPESAITNAVAFESMFKIVLMSHSTVENLTRDWVETTSVVPTGLDCHPCHRIHTDMKTCTQDSATRASACMASVKPDAIADEVLRYLEWLQGQAKVAA